MFINSYQKPTDFLAGTINHPNLIKSAYVRDNVTAQIISEKDLKSLLLSTIPILGTIRGIARLYSIWSVKDRSQDSTKDLIVHTSIGILEILGLGLFRLVLDISLAVLGILIFIAIGITALVFHIVKKSISFLTKPCHSK
ncbi:hypothetical protein O1W69_05070 [Chlamydia sp. 12-01]|uniref:hypothetical protein n=1 Tax=Chlamydia sp. 12-01 TaxID=3002742 RepID=UPI0035D4E3BC